MAKTGEAPAIVWFREDLRLADNPALHAAAASGRPIACIFVLEDGTPGIRPRGGASRWWLHGSLEALAADLARHSVPLILRRGRAVDILPTVARETGVAEVHWNRRYSGAESAVDLAMEEALARDGVAALTHSGKLVIEPGTLVSGSGASYRIFTPWWRAAQAAMPHDPPLPVPRNLTGSAAPRSDSLDDWGLLPAQPDWADGLRATWTPGERQARKALAQFVDNGLRTYAAKRDRPAESGTTRLSPHLASGELSPREVQAALDAAGAGRGGPDLSKLRSELAWRDFAWAQMVEHPDMATANLNPAFDAFPFAQPGDALAAWQQGRTGYPIVDAAMRELWRTGWMHNRLRLITASFLVKHLLIDWRHGEAWFWDTLVDADAANNAINWQWAAGSGADASPYFRIFNPVLQGRKFDPDGAFVRAALPGLAKLPARYVHEPWTAPAAVLADAGLALGKTYPAPMVVHEQARARALAALATMRGDRH